MQHGGMATSQLIYILVASLPWPFPTIEHLDNVRSCLAGFMVPEVVLITV
jgi:hypothetical protein